MKTLAYAVAGASTVVACLMMTDNNVKGLVAALLLIVARGLAGHARMADGGHG